MIEPQHAKTSNLAASRQYGWRTDIEDDLLEDPLYVANMKAYMAEGMSEEQARTEIIKKRVERMRSP